MVTVNKKEKGNKMDKFKNLEIANEFANLTFIYGGKIVFTSEQMKAYQKAVRCLIEEREKILNEQAEVSVSASAHNRILELEKENERIKNIDYYKLVEEFEMGLYMPRCDVEEYYVPIERLNDYVEKSELAEILKQRLQKYQAADDGQYKQKYLTRGELELVDRYKECSELLKILCEEDIYKIELDYIPKSKVREKIEEYSKLQEEMTNKNHQTNNINDCYKYGDNAQKAYYKKEALQELLQEGDDK